MGVHVTGQAAGRHLADGRLTLHRGARDQAVRAANRQAGQLVEADGPDADERVPRPEPDDSSLDVAWLVRRAAAGDRSAWERLVAQYARLIWAMTRDFRLAESDAADVAQVTWLRLLEHIDRLEHPARVGSWLVTTARHECLRSVAAQKRMVPGGDGLALDDVARHEPEIDERLLAEERAEVVRDALARLPWRWQRLIELQMADPPASYAEISEQLGLPVGSIGPTRGRCLARLRVLLQAS